MELVDEYIAVWNETDAAERRRRIGALWTPDGTTSNRLIEACGYEAIEARVTGSSDKWLREGKYVFRPRQAAHRRDVVKVDWEMATALGGVVEAAGVSFLVVDLDGRIAHDYQFNPTLNDAEALAQRYVAVWSEPDAQARRRRIAELWAPDGSHVAQAAARDGHGAIEAEAQEAFDAYMAKGSEFSFAGSSQAHHNVARVAWRLGAKAGGEPARVGASLLILDERGRIRFDYPFDEPI
jgi:hypothetical protein